MNATFTDELGTLAAKMMLTPKQAVALPVAIENAAGKVRMTQEDFVAECFANAPLASYVASVCRMVTA